MKYSRLQALVIGSQFTRWSDDPACRSLSEPANLFISMCTGFVCASWRGRIEDSFTSDLLCGWWMDAWSGRAGAYSTPECLTSLTCKGGQGGQPV